MRILSTMVFILSTSITSSLFAFSNHETSDWALIESSDSVKVYGRNVKNLPNAREIKAILSVPQSPESLLALMVDYPNATSWRKRLKGIEKVKVIDENNWYINYITDLPWPLDDRVAYLKCEVVRDKNMGSIVYAFESAPNESSLSEQETLSGSYQFTPLKNGQTEVIYQVTIESPVKVPKWVESALLGDSFITQMELLKEAVAQSKYLAAH